jgi:hypothetical protein
MNTSVFGYHIGNGSYSGVMGEIQNGLIDTWATYVLAEATTAEHFLYTNTFASERYAFAMLRESNVMDFNFNGLVAGIGALSYVLLAICLFVLATVLCLNEKCETNVGRNTFWEIVNLLMPMNTNPLPYETGFTRRILIATCGFTVLLATTYYQCNLLQELMAPKPVKKLTMNDVINDIRTHKRKLYFYDHIFDVIANIDELQLALKINPPVILSADNPLIEKEHDILFAELSEIFELMSRNKPEDCANYAVFVLEEIDVHFVTWILRKERRDILETLNVIVAERMDFVTRLLEKNQLSDECRNHIFPPNVAEPRFKKMSMYTLSGVFTLLMCLSVVALITFLVEILFGKCRAEKKNIDIDATFDKKAVLQSLDDLMDIVPIDKQQLAIMHYDVLRAALNKYEGDIDESNVF